MWSDEQRTTIVDHLIGVAASIDDSRVVALLTIGNDGDLHIVEEFGDTASAAEIIGMYQLLYGSRMRRAMTGFEPSVED